MPFESALFTLTGKRGGGTGDDAAHIQDKITDTGSASRDAAKTNAELVEEIGTRAQRCGRVVAVENLESIELLRQVGFDEDVALELSQKRGLQEIKQQIEWLPHRNAERNSLGMLRKAIQGDWSKPDTICNAEKKQQRLQQDQTEATQAEIDDDRVSEAKQDKKRRRERLLPIWDSLTLAERNKIEQEILAQLNSDFLRERFKKNEEFRLNQCLDFFGNFANQQQDILTSKISETDR